MLLLFDLIWKECLNSSRKGHTQADNALALFWVEVYPGQADYV
jgi:hypothetical protein